MSEAALDRAQPVAVVGAGTMGAGIAHVAAAAGHVVHLYDADASAVEHARSQLGERLRRSVDKGRITETEADAVLSRVIPAPSLEGLADAGLVIEAIVEDLAVKQGLLSRIEALVGAEALIATNTSSLSVTAIAAILHRPDRVVGMHFFNPAPVMPLVEIVAGEATSPSAMDRAAATVAAWGKTPVRCASTPGFIVNRVARPFYGEALRLVSEGAANAATIDAVVTGAGGFRMGPFALMDLVGLDVNLAVSKSVYAQTFHDARFAPSVLQQSLVDAGRLGRKTGRGFFDYSAEETEAEDAATSITVSFPEGPPAVQARGDLGHAAPLLERLAATGVEIMRVAPDEPLGHLRIGPAVLVPTDGRTATELAAAGTFGTDEVVVLDLAGDWREAQRGALAPALQALRNPEAVFAGVLQAAGVAVSVVGDTPGLVVMRIVAQLASVAADAVLVGVADAEGVDTAMRLGTNYPRGPLEWADEVGATTVVAVLDHLRGFYGEDRYRASAVLRRGALAGTTMRDTGAATVEAEGSPPQVGETSPMKQRRRGGGP